MRYKSIDRRYLAIASTAFITTLLAGCSTPKPMYDGEKFTATDTFSRTVEATPSQACDAGRRTLMSQGYVITQAKDNDVNGTKGFQPQKDDHYEIQFHLVCASVGNNANQASVFVNAVQDRYALKKTNNSASVGLSVLGSVSMPFGSSEDSLVKVGSETIPAGTFYDGFFSLLKQYIDRDPSHALPKMTPAEEQAAKAAALKAQNTPSPAPAGTPAAEESAAKKNDAN
jgi:hypothetical protein